MAEVAEAFNGKGCAGDHLHHRIVGAAAISRDAGHYPLPLCRLVVDCFERCWARQALVPHQVLAAEDEDEHDGEASSEDDELPGGEPDGKPISKEVFRQVMKLCVQTGHWLRRRLARALAIAGAPEEALRTTKFSKCDICHEKKRPQPRRVAALPRSCYFNDVAHTDLVHVFDAIDAGFWLLNVVSSASGFVAVSLLESKTSGAVISGFEKIWHPRGGAPLALVADMGPELISKKFACWSELHGTRLHHVPVEAPWQNGAAPRAGGGPVAEWCRRASWTSFQDRAVKSCEGVWCCGKR